MFKKKKFNIGTILQTKKLILDSYINKLLITIKYP